MIRRLHCRKCGDSYHLHPEDKAMGFVIRKTNLIAQVPAGHGIRVNGVFEPMSDLLCDSCAAIITGQDAVATCEWNTNHEGEPGDWESVYGVKKP